MTDSGEDRCRLEPLLDVWRTKDRLHTDDATSARLCDLAARDPAIREVIGDLQPDEPGNGSVWASGVTRHDGTAALLKLGARDAERQWMTSIDVATTDVVPRVFGSGDLRGVGWLVLERCDVRLDRTLSTDVAAVVRSAARYQQAATGISAATSTMDLDEVRANLIGARAQDCPGDVDRALAGAERSWAFITAECGLGVNHGDVHFGNVVARQAHGPALLIDPMPVSTVWAWDAAYLEVMSGHPGVIRQFAGEREALGLSTADDMNRVERIALGWVAALWWRIAPWRHEDPAWRRKVEHWVQGLES